MKRIAYYALLILGSAAVLYAVAVLFFIPEKGEAASSESQDESEVQDIPHTEVPNTTGKEQ